MSTRFKICCIQSHKEAAFAIEAGASALGLVAAMPSGPGVIDESRIADIARQVPPGIATFLLTSETAPARIAAQWRRCLTTAIQCCDHLDAATHAGLAALVPGVKRVQVVHVADEESVAYAQSIAPHVHALLLDSGRLDRDVKELGGTGRVHDWTLSRRIREAVAVPVYLAGGLNGRNARDAIDAVQPFGLDVCSGVRTDSALDATKLAAFARAVREGAAA
ncbi:MAG: phosphoribosylanthranilate isomerase [Betaproteobacteria bacterium]|nr:phosphoribosylanthranilate isomerase [Betaproteobacteria bacterium]